MEFTILFIPIAWLLFSKYWLNNSITFAEVLIGAVLISLSASMLYSIGSFNLTEDQEIWNGKITEKIREKVSCEHGYRCNCSSSGSIESCSTCYKHGYDIDWILHTTAGDIAISRVDYQGLNTPPVWEKAYLSEPASIIKHYQNYIQAVPSSLFNDENFEIEERFKALIPSYPIYTHGVYHLNHVIAVDVYRVDTPRWNDMMAEMLKKLSPQKEVNVLVVFVNTQDPAYLQSLQKTWSNGNKNDVILVIGSTHYPDIDWVDVISWTPSELFKVKLRDEISAIGKIDPALIIPAIEKRVIQSFIRLQMSHYEHLINEIVPPEEFRLWIWLVLLLGPVIYTLLAHKFDITNAVGTPVFVFIFGFLEFYLDKLFGISLFMSLFVLLFLAFLYPIVNAVFFSKRDSKS